jgi:lipopolysaccharide biosynthesis glycosyltransferase
MYHFCTITTADHMYKTMALYDSIRAISADSHLHVLCIDQLQDRPQSDHISLYSTADLKGQNAADTIISAYGSSRDKLRWCMKPVFLRYLTAQKADKVIYVDNDIYFHGDYSFLFELLDEYDFLLTPHHYPRDPHHDQNWLEANFKVGLYNAGFIGVNKDAAESLDWWADCCAYRCEKNPLRGTFDDQKYLDLIPVMNEKAHVIRHKGCNVAEWNRKVISRSEQNGKVILDRKYPLIFIHYNGTTIRAIIEGAEPCLRPSYELYLKNLRKYKADIDPESLMNHMSLTDRIKYAIWKFATRQGL